MINHYYKKVKQGFSSKKNHKKLAKSQQAKKLGRFEIKVYDAWIANNKQMFAVKLLANLVVASDCYIVLNMFEHNKWIRQLSCLIHLLLSMADISFIKCLQMFSHFTFPISLDVLIIIDYC